MPKNNSQKPALTPGARTPKVRSLRARALAFSVRTRIVTAITLVTAIGLVAVGVSVYFVERHRILEQVDVRLKANLESARYIVAEGSVETGTWESSTQALKAVVERMSPDDNTGAFGMADGVITTVPGMNLDLDLSDEQAFAKYADRRTGDSGPVIGTYAEDGVVWRYLAVPIAIDASPDPSIVTFVMVYDLEAELAEFDEAARIFAIVSAIVLAAVAATGIIVATRLLRPLRRMKQTAERVSAQSLEERLPVVGNDDVAALTETMNQMLDRLDDALTSQRQLLSDVGHELKTPITIVRGQLEVMDVNDPEDTRETRAIVVDELARMARLVQDLSAAAALHGPRPVQLQSVDLADLLRQIGRKAGSIVGATVALGDVAEGVAQIDPERITQAVLQLVQNAVTHGGGRVDLSSEISNDASFSGVSNSAGPHLRISVRDYGPGVPSELQDQVFDRFVRGSRTDSSTSSGLGLSIVRVIARAHGGDARVTNADTGDGAGAADTRGARFDIILPLQQASH